MNSGSWEKLKKNFNFFLWTVLYLLYNISYVKFIRLYENMNANPNQKIVTPQDS